MEAEATINAITARKHHTCINFFAIDPKYSAGYLQLSIELARGMNECADFQIGADKK